MPPPAKSMIATSVSDFTVVPLTLRPLPSYPRETTHYLYLHANAPKVPTPETPREVFLVNVPIDATETHIRSLFTVQLGGARIDSVAFEGARVGKGITAPVAPVNKGKKRKRGEVENEEVAEEQVGLLPEVWDRGLHRSGGTAVVTFVDQTSAQLALKESKRAVKNKKTIVWGAGVEGKSPPLGSARYFTHRGLCYPNHFELQRSVDEYIAAFSASEIARTQALARRQNLPDEDGFITVTRGGRTATAREEDAQTKEEEFKKREKDRVKSDFYRFQVREKWKEQARDLVKSFENDMRKVELMRRRRGRMKPE